MVISINTSEASSNFSPEPFKKEEVKKEVMKNNNNNNHNAHEEYYSYKESMGKKDNEDIIEI